MEHSKASHLTVIFLCLDFLIAICWPTAACATSAGCQRSCQSSCWPSHSSRARISSMQASVPPFTETKVTFGVGTSPVGADVIFLPEKPWQPFTGVHAGISYFTRNVLSSHAAQFNFLLDGRAGVRFSLRGGKSLSVAYMFQHMSNAYTALENPGVDSHMVHLAYAFPFRFRRANR